MPDQGQGGVLAPVQMPPMSILGLVMGGRGYAADWYGQKDKLSLSQALQLHDAQQRELAAKGILSSPELAAIAPPGSEMRKQYDLWGTFEGRNVPETMAAAGNQLLSQGVGNVNQRANMATQQGYAVSNLALEDQYMKGRSVFDADVQLKLKQAEMQLAAQQQQQYLQDLTAPDPVTGQNNMIAAAKRNYAAKALNFNIPEGYQIMPDATAQEGFSLTPTPGGKPYLENLDKMTSSGNLAADGQRLLDHYSGKTILSRGEYDGIVSRMQASARKGFTLGTMDEGSTKWLENVIPGYGWTGKDWSGNDSERLRVLVEGQQRNMQQIADQTKIPLSAVQHTAPEYGSPSAQQIEENRKRLESQKLQDSQRAAVPLLAPPPPGAPQPAPGSAQSATSASQRWNDWMDFFRTPGKNQGNVWDRPSRGR